MTGLPGSRGVALAMTAAGLIGGAFCAEGIAAPVLPGDGVSFSQLDLLYQNVQQTGSAYGLAAVDTSRLTTTAGIASGFLNVATSAGWVIRNMPIDSSSGYPGLSAIFNLGQSGPLSSLSAAVDFSDTPIAVFQGGPQSAFAVTHLPYNAEGVGGSRTALPQASVDASLISFQLGGNTFAKWQPGHTSVEQDLNQCAPASVANSLQWLEDRFGLNVPDEHKKGIRDDTLVGKLDKAMQRQAHATVTGVGDIMDGKLEYLIDAGLAEGLRIKHKTVTGSPAQDYRVGELVSREDKSGLGFMKWIEQEIKAGEDVEMVVYWDDGGGHAVDLVGVGEILGVPWLAWTHDANQGFDDKGTAANGGVSWFDGGIGWSPVVDGRLIMFVNGKRGPASVGFLASESVPEPGVLWLLSGAFLAGLVIGGRWRRCADAPVDPLPQRAPGIAAREGRR